MGKSNTVCSKDRDTGIEVTVIMSQEKCEILLIIPLENIICPNFSVKNNDFECRLKLSKAKKKLTQVATLRFEGKYSKLDCGLFKSKQLSFKFKEPDFSGQLILNPKFYIPAEKRYNPEKVKEFKFGDESNRTKRARMKTS